ncbi:MAG: PAS domain-containing protein, partial [Candidatus Eremiobacterota bacterium]
MGFTSFRRGGKPKTASLQAQIINNMYYNTILIADDEPATLNLYKSIFKKRLLDNYFNIETFENGIKLLEYLKNIYAGGGRVPLCVLDMHMPVMSGLETARELRITDPDIIIIIITGYSDISFKNIMENLQQDIYYIRKPFDREHLYCLTNSLIKGWNKNFQLKESEERLRFALEGTSDGLWDISFSDKDTYCSPRCYTMLGYKPYEFPWNNENLLKLIHPDDRDIIEKKFYHQLKSNKNIHTDEYRLKTKSGKWKWISSKGKVVERDEEGKIKRIVGTYIDITRSKKARDALLYRFKVEKFFGSISTKFINIEPHNIDREIENTLGLLGEFTGIDRSYIHLMDGNKIIKNVYQWVNKEISHGGGISIEHMPWAIEKLKNFHIIDIPDMTQVFHDTEYEENPSPGPGIKSILILPLVYNKSLIGLLGFELLRDKRTWLKEDVELIKMVGNVFVNAIMHKKTSEVLRASESNFRKLSQEYQTFLEAIQDLVMVISPDLTILWANSIAKSYCNSAGEQCHDFFNCFSCENCSVLSTFVTGHTEKSQIITPDNKYFDITVNPIKDDDGHVNQLLLIASNVTEKMILQKDAFRTYHLASIGELAAGVAHEINNPLNSIINCAQLLTDRINKDTKEYNFSQIIMEQSRRIAIIIKNLLAFSRPAVGEKVPVFIDTLFSATISLIHANL